jgi:ParB family chromosome partitioning protein
MKPLQIDLVFESPENPADRYSGPAFAELVASIKEKGVLMPILVRPVKGRYEVVAGNRRLCAAKDAGLTEIPARVAEMSDTEAREARIVENLQRADLHPIEEGEQYRILLVGSKGGYTTADIAARVGKTEPYVRQRLALTNLCEKAKKLYRDGAMSPRVAVMLARMEDTKLQAQIVKDASDWQLKDEERMRQIIQDAVYKDLGSKPWAKDARLAEEVGDKPKHESLFGDKESGHDPVAYAQQMARYIEIMVRKAEKKGETMVRISTEYGQPEIKGVLPRDSYRILHGKEELAEAKTKQKGIVAEGDPMGQVYWITTDSREHDARGNVKPTTKEKAARKRELDKQKKKKAAAAKLFQTAISKIKAPLSDKQLDALLEFAFYHCGFSYQQPAGVLLGLEPVKTKEKRGWSSENEREVMVNDWGATLRKYADENGAAGKLKVIFALLMPHPDTSEYSGGNHKFIKASKRL